MRDTTDYSRFNSRNIYEKITDKRALFLCLDALDFSAPSGAPSPRLKVRCCNYDSDLAAGEKITSEVDAFIPLSKFLVLCHNILTGVYYRQKVKNAGASSSPYFTHFGGTVGPPICSKRFAVVDGKGDASFAFLATSGAGSLGKNSEITPAKGASPDQSIFINMPDDEMKEFCLIGKAYAEQYIALDLETRLKEVRRQRDAYTKNMGAPR